MNSCSSGNTIRSVKDLLECLIYSVHGALILLESLLLFFYWNADRVTLDYYLEFYIPEITRIGFYKASCYLFDNFLISLSVLLLFGLIFSLICRDREISIRVSVLSLLHVLFFSLCFFIFKSLSF